VDGSGNKITCHGELPIVCYGFGIAAAGWLLPPLMSHRGLLLGYGKHTYQKVDSPCAYRPPGLKETHGARSIDAMKDTGQLFGWAFGDTSKVHEPGYLDAIRRSALENAKQDAASRGFDVEEGTESYSVIEQGETLVDVEAAPGGLIVRCTVTLVGAGAADIKPEGPMNG
jgi:hypothetical protein